MTDPSLATGPGGPEAIAAIAASADWERAAAVAVLVGATAAALVGWRRRRLPAPPLPPPTRRTELILVALLLGATVVSRTALGGAAWHPRWYFAQSTTLFAARALERSTLLAEWLEALGKTQVTWPQDSAIFFPVSVALQAWLGPSDRLPLLVGTLWGTAGVGLAWLCGRTIVSPWFGLVFAGMVAASPLQLVWSRLGSLPVAAATHVLLVVWLMHRAGRRASVPLAACAGIAAWASVYHHFLARIALPAGLVALMTGFREGRRGVRRAIPVVSAAIGTLAAAAAVVEHAGGQGLWPRYRGYVGSRGEAGVVEVLKTAGEAAAGQSQRALALYFVRGRAGSLPAVWRLAAPGTTADVRTPGIAWGGLTLAPVAVLGVVGLLLAVRHPWRHAVWLTMAAGGFALTVLGAPSARRFLVFDLAWCALAALALTRLLDARPWCWLGLPGRRLLAVAVPAGLLAWSAATIGVLWHALPWRHAEIPFGESGFGDGLTCLGCVELGRRWKEDVARGTVVVSVDSDLDRENPTSPAGVLLYGKLAALTAGRAEAFVDLYSVLRGFEIETPYVRRFYDPRRFDGPRFLAALIDTLQPAAIAWDFVQPTRWEEELIARLVQAGGLKQPLAAPPIERLRFPWGRTGYRVLTRFENRDAAFDALTRHLDTNGGDEAVRPCASVRRIATDTAPGLVLTIGDVPGGAMPPAAGSHRWVVALPDRVLTALDGNAPSIPLWDAIAFGAAAQEAETLVLTWNGVVHRIDAAGQRRAEAPLGVGPRIGRSCAARAGGRWWIVDPLAGGITAMPLPPWPLPAGPWIGVARLDDGRLALGGADQRVRVLDLGTGAIVADFPAPVPPSRRYAFAECSAMAGGNDWIATLDPLRRRLSLTGTDGESLGSLYLDDLLGAPGDLAQAIAGSGAHLAIAFANQVQTFTVTRPSVCP